MKDQIISAALNIGCGLVAAYIYDWVRGRRAPAPASVSRRAQNESPASGAARARRAPMPEAAPAGARGGVLGAIVLLLVLGALGLAAALALHRLGIAGVARPGVETLVKQGAIIALSMIAFVWLLGRLRRG